MLIDGIRVGHQYPAYIVAEIGLNHNGSVTIAKQLIDVAISAGCNAVKFQKRTPELCVPVEQRNILRDTPWGKITYMEYRTRVEFYRDEYKEIDKYCTAAGISWFVSCWDKEAINFAETFQPPCFKIPSACLTDDALLKYAATKGRTILLSTGMSSPEQINYAYSLIPASRLILMHCTSTYPAKTEELNLQVISTFRDQYKCPIGYSGHETGLQTTVAAVVLGACVIERHITLDRAMWGTDQSASIEPQGLHRLVRDIRKVEAARGDGIKRVYDSELPIMQKLRRNR